MTWINFRKLDAAARARMRQHNAHAVKKAEDAEIRVGGGVWVRRKDFGGALDGLPSERPTKAGTMIRG